MLPEDVTKKWSVRNKRNVSDLDHLRMCVMSRIGWQPNPFVFLLSAIALVCFY